MLREWRRICGRGRLGCSGLRPYSRNSGNTISCITQAKPPPCVVVREGPSYLVLVLIPAYDDRYGVFKRGCNPRCAQTRCTSGCGHPWLPVGTRTCLCNLPARKTPLPRLTAPPSTPRALAWPKSWKYQCFKRPFKTLDSSAVNCIERRRPRLTASACIWTPRPQPDCPTSNSAH